MTGVPVTGARVTGAPVRRRRGLHVATGLVLVLVVLLAVAGWLGIRGVLAARHLQAARSSLLTARAALTEYRFADAAAAVDSAGQDTAAARRLTGDPVWSAVAAVPGVGNTLTASRGLARAADDTSRRLLPGVLGELVKVGPAALRGRRAANAALLQRLQPVLRTATEQARQISADVAALPTSYVPGPVTRARETFGDQLQQLVAALSALLRT